MFEQPKTFSEKYGRLGSIVAMVAAGCILLAGCGSSGTKPQAQSQPAAQQQTAGAGQNDEKSFKDSCKELELRGLNTNYTQYVNKLVKASGPVKEVVKLNTGNVRVKIQYPDTDAVWVTTEKAMLREPKVGKQVEFWGVLTDKGDKSKLPEVTAKYLNVL